MNETRAPRRSTVADFHPNPFTYTSGTVVRYTPDQSRHSPNWCREGTAIANERGALVDTYWGGGGGVDAHVVNDAETDSVEVLFHMDDYDELDRWRPDRQRWGAYAPADRQRITMQHGLQERLFLRKGAEPDLPTQIGNAEEKVQEAGREARSAEWHLQLAREEHAALAERADAERVETP